MELVLPLSTCDPSSSSVGSSGSMRPILVTRVFEGSRRSREWCHVACDVVRVSRGVLIGSPTNRNASCGRVVFPNLGYKKDAFLEPSLVSNNISLSPNKPTSTIPSINQTASFLIAPCPPTTCNSNNHSNPLVLLALIPAVALLFLEVLLVLCLWTQWGDRLWQGFTGYVPV